MTVINPLLYMRTQTVGKNHLSYGVGKCGGKESESLTEKRTRHFLAFKNQYLPSVFQLCIWAVLIKISVIKVKSQTMEDTLVKNQNQFVTKPVQQT